jgi:hypothetical protein
MLRLVTWHKSSIKGGILKYYLTNEFDICLINFIDYYPPGFKESGFLAETRILALSIRLEGVTSSPCQKF